MGITDCFERCFFRLYPTKKKETINPNGHWLRCVMLIATFLHFGMALFCMALVGFAAMILNILQCVWSYSVYLTLREREMCFYILALLAQLVQCFFSLFKGDETATGAFQTGGTIGNIVGCCVMLFMGGRALWKFHSTGGLHGSEPDDDLEEPLLELNNDESIDKAPADDDKKKKTTASEK